MRPDYRQQVQSGSCVFKSLVGAIFTFLPQMGDIMHWWGEIYSLSFPAPFFPSFTSPQALTPTSGLASSFLHSQLASSVKGPKSRNCTTDIIATVPHGAAAVGNTWQRHSASGGRWKRETGKRGTGILGTKLQDWKTRNWKTREQTGFGKDLCKKILGDRYQKFAHAKVSWRLAMPVLLLYPVGINASSAACVTQVEARGLSCALCRTPITMLLRLY